MSFKVPIFLVVLLSNFASNLIECSYFDPTLLHRHPNPVVVAQEVYRRVNVSLSRRLSTEEKDQLPSCATGNPIDDCWRCDSNWANNRDQLADCALGFGEKALGGKGGQIYVVNDSSDPDPNNLKTGTLRHAVTQREPIWIIFLGDMHIKLKRPLVVTSFKTIDGRGADVHITGDGCITIDNATNVIVHSINIHSCRSVNSDGDGLRIIGSTNIWIDHCTLADCDDGLIDCTLGSTAITISNNHFSHQDKVMLLGHSDDYPADKGMQVTVAFNRFGQGLVQRMPRCRFGYFHIVNNDYRGWGDYAIGGSSAPTINSQGNRYIAATVKEVTRRIGNENEWKSWDWKTNGDLMVNGAFFASSGDDNPLYAYGSSDLEPKPVTYIDELTMNAGVI